MTDNNATPSASCTDAVAFVDGELPDDHAAAYRDHLAQCEPCQAALVGNVQLNARLSQPSLDTVTRDLFMGAPIAMEAGQRLDLDPAVPGDLLLDGARAALLLRVDHLDQLRNLRLECLDRPMMALAVTKRFFELDDDDCYYYVVASDLDHARTVLGATGVKFGDHFEGGPRTLVEAEAAGDVHWREIDATEAARKRCHTEDVRDRGTILLTACDLGEWFCTEY